MAARTVKVELLAPSRAKQEAFQRLQGEVLRLGQDWAQATAGIAQAFAGSVETRSLAPLADQASVFALRSLTAAEKNCDTLPEPWRSTLRDFLRRQAVEVKILRRRAKRPDAPPSSPRRGLDPAVVFGQESWSIRVDDGKWKLVIPLLGRTVAMPIAVPEGQSDRLRQLMAEGIPLEGRLYQRRGRWFFAARYLNDAPRPRTDAPAIGVDLGRALRAVAVEEKSGKRLILSGKRDRAQEARYRRLARDLHAAGAHRKARQTEAKLERFSLQRSREAAVAITTFAKQFDRPVLKFEAETSQDFTRVIRMTARRAEPLGIAVAAVDGRQSSLRCSRCGAVSPEARTGSRFVCTCGYTAHADINAARNLSQTATWSQSLQFAAAGQSPGGQAVDTAVRASRDRNKVGSEDAASGGAPSEPSHVVSTTHHNLAASFRKEEYKMASIVKDLSESSTKFVVGTLDNLKSYVDKTSEELSKVDVVNVTRHILDTALDGAKNVAKQTTEQSSLDAFGTLKALADSSLEATREVVNVIAEEGKKADVFGMSTRIALEGINTLRAEVDLGIDTTKNLVNRLAPLATTAKPVVTRPPQVTRVEIEHEKPAKSSSKSTSAS
jgi:hypothetical protein